MDSLYITNKIGNFHVNNLLILNSIVHMVFPDVNIKNLSIHTLSLANGRITFSLIVETRFICTCVLFDRNCVMCLFWSKCHVKRFVGIL